MTGAEWIALVGVGVTALAGAGGHLIKWGRHSQKIESAEGRIQKLEDVGAADKIVALGGRVISLENDVGRFAASMQKLEISNAKVETKLEGIVEQLKDLNASLRWGRDQAGHDSGKA